MASYERTYFEGGPLVVSAEGKEIKLTINAKDGSQQYLFIKFPANDGLRVIKDIHACLYQIIAMEDETE